MSSIYRAILIDDDPEALDILDSLLRDFSEIKVVARATGAADALKSIMRHDSDLIFLDIEMPGKDGFDLIREMKQFNLNPVIIFVTAYNQYAIRAFKVSAFDYLLKPLDMDELAKCIHRLKEEENKTSLAGRIEHLLDQLDPGKKIRIHTRSGYYYYYPDEIFYLEADSSYTNLYLTSGKKQVITSNLGKMLSDLPPQFIEISRSAVINLTYLKQVDHKNMIANLVCDGLAVNLKISRNHRDKVINLR